MIIPAAIDTEARQASPSANFATASKLGVRGAGSSAVRRAYVFTGAAPFPAGATVLAATLRLRLAGAWSGTNNLTCKRVTTKWGENTLTYNTQPTVSGTHVATKTVTGGADGDVCEFNVASMLQDVAAGGPFFGFQITLSQDAARLFYSTECGDASLIPELEITWSEAPETPDRLSPDGDLAVSVEFPVLSWRFADRSGSTVQASAQVQLMQGTDDFSTPDFDTTKIALAESEYDTSSGGFGGVDDGEDWYWRVKVWDETDFESEWSAPAQFNRADLGSLSLDSPGATVGETTPPIEWTLTGATQERYRATLLRVEDSGALTELWKASDTNAVTDSVTPDAGLIKTGPTYRARIEVWDDVDRAGDDHLTEEQDFTYVTDTSPDPVDAITVVVYKDTDGHTTPAVQIDFTRASAPDYFCVTVDGEEVLDRVAIADCHVSGDDYRIIYWGLTPRQTVTVGIEAVVLDTGKYLHSATLEAPDVTPRPVGIWLVDDSTPGADSTDALPIFGTEGADLVIGETATTFDLIGAQAPVRITDVIRGYEGSISGSLLGQAARDLFYDLKGRRVNLRLIVGDLSIPVRMEEGHAIPTPNPGDGEFVCAFTCFQVGAPWPVATP